VTLILNSIPSAVDPPIGERAGAHLARVCRRPSVASPCQVGGGLLGFAWVVGGRDGSIPEPECPRRRLFLVVSPAVGRSCLFFCPVLLVVAARGFLLCAVAPPAGLKPPAPRAKRQGVRRRALARPLVGGASGPRAGLLDPVQKVLTAYRSGPLTKL
jgi:hypothetical protein